MAYQGSLDGLCGPYAIVNAYHQCEIEEDSLGKDIFAIACLAVKGGLVCCGRELHLGR